MEIRSATEADLEALLRLYEQLSSENTGTNESRAANALREMLGRTGLHLLVVEDGGQAVATVTVVLIPNLTHGAEPWAQLENMVVAETHRGTGVGRRLLEHAVRLAWDAGCYKVQLQSANHRAGAHRFYESAGFKASSRGYRLYR